MSPHHAYHSLGIGVAKVGGMGRSVVHHGLVNRVGRLVREYARGQAGHNLPTQSWLVYLCSSVVNTAEYFRYKLKVLESVPHED